MNACSPSHSFVAHGKLVEAAILIHADDIICVGNPRGRPNFESCINSPLHGDIEELRIGKPLVFCGIEVTLFNDRHITLSQSEFYWQIPELHLNHFARDSKNVTVGKDPSKTAEGVCRMLSLASEYPL